MVRRDWPERLSDRFFWAKGAVILIALLLQSLTYAKAQDYRSFGIGLGLGINSNIADTHHAKASLSATILYTYALNRNIHFFTEGQLGFLEGYDDLNNPYGKSFKNTYQSIAIGYQVGLGAFIKETSNGTVEALRNLFLSAGGGAIRNQITEIQEYKSAGELYPIKLRSYNLTMPLTIGYNLPVVIADDDTRLNLRLAYQGTFTFGEGLDGYNEIGKEVNKNPDVYTLFSLGVTYKFGATRW